MLRRGRFLTGNYDEELGSKDVTWLTPLGDEMGAEHWSDDRAKSVGVLLDGRAQASGIRRPGTDATIYLVFNAHHDIVNFTLPAGDHFDEWVLLIDTNQPAREDMPAFKAGHIYGATARSLLLFHDAAKNNPPTTSTHNAHTSMSWRPSNRPWTRILAFRSPPLRRSLRPHERGEQPYSLLPSWVNVVARQPFGMITVSITWMTPFEQAISAVVTVAPLTTTPFVPST